MPLWQPPCVWGSWLHTVLALAGKELLAVEAGVPQAYFCVLVCRPHVGVFEFDQRGSWALTPCILSFYTQFYPLLLTWSQKRCFHKLFFFFNWVKAFINYKVRCTGGGILSLIKAGIL